MSPISNPALLPTGALATPVVPAGASRKSGASAPTDPNGTTTGAGAGAGTTQGASFADALKQADHSHELQFSKHALARVQRRGIELDSATLGRLSQGVQRAASKGSRDSLVLVDGTAFVVSVNNRTVITAVGSEHMKDNVFTNIDSAVIA
jgi:flagellar operon protein